MEKVINDYERYTENRYDIWRKRFVWNKGTDPQWKTGIMRFIKETDEIEKVIEHGVPRNSDELFNTVKLLADRYVAWVKMKDGDANSYSESDYDDMHNHFVGAIGEYFFVYLLTEVRCVSCYNQSKDYNRFDFHYTSLFQGKDFGIDVVSVVSTYEKDMSCAIQVKFWNPFNDDETPDMAMFQKLGYEAYRNGYADPKEDKNLFLCWLGEESRIYNILKDNDMLLRSVVVIGKHSLDETVNNRNKFFWDGFFKSLLNFKVVE